MNEHIETRWAAWNYKAKQFCGRYCWSDCPRINDKNGCRVPTFRTRELARNAIRRMTSYREESRPIKVTIRFITT